MSRFRFIVFALVLVGVIACQKEPSGQSATDSLPFPIESDKDLSTRPGDDFWQYCNGGWYAKTPTPASSATGGPYEMFPAMEDMVQRLIDKVPSLKKFFQLWDQMYDHQAEGAAFLSQLKAQQSVPQTREEAFRTIGRMMAEGMTPINLSLIPDYKDGQLIGLLSSPGEVYKYSFSDLDPSVKTEVGWVVEGMGMDPATLYYNDVTLLIMGIIGHQPLEDLLEIIEQGWAEYYPFLSEEGLNLFNTLNRKTWTKEYASQVARSCVGYELSYYLATEYVPAELKAHYLDLIERFRDAFRIRIQSLDWMSETTRSHALDKLEKMMAFAGYPDVWYEDCLPDLSQCTSLVEAVYLLNRDNFKLTRHLIGTRDVLSSKLTSLSLVADGEWTVTDLSFVNAYYSRDYNSIVILPAMMLPPLIRRDYSEAYEYGMLVTVAHEITHGFDSNGSQYDALGRKQNWWTVADKMAFEDEQQKLIRCYSALEYDPAAYPGQYGDGERTLAENIADLGGFLIARDAYIKRLKDQGFTGENYKAQLKKFHESYAHLQAIKYSAEKLQDLVTTDVHSHCRLRINGVMMNTDMWYDIYDVSRDDLLYLPPSRRTYIW